jgi:uncharacterized protein YoxC
VADATPGVTGADQDPDRIEREMEQTRESITQKVSLLENQVLGTIQTATNTLTDTVQTVKDTVTTAPAAVKETVAAVKDSVRETFASVKDSVASFSLTDCTRNHPGAALGTSVVGGFLTGFLLLGGRESRPLMARGFREPAPGGRPGTVPHEYAPFGGATGSHGHAAPAQPGIFSGLMGMVGSEIEQLARQALTTAIASLKQSVNEKVPRLMDDAVQTLADRVTGHNGAAHAADTRHTAYGSSAPAAGL